MMVGEKTLFVNVGQWEEICGMRFKLITFPNGFGARVEKQGNKYLVDAIGLDGFVNHDIFFEAVPLLDAHEVEKHLEEISLL